MSAVGLLFAGRGVFITGVEDDEHGATRVYVSGRYRNLYFLVSGEDAENVKREWTNPHHHLVIDRNQVGHLVCGHMPDGSWCRRDDCPVHS